MFSMKSVYIIKGLGIVAEGDFRYPRTELTLTPDDFTMEVYEYKGWKIHDTGSRSIE